MNAVSGAGFRVNISATESSMAKLRALAADLTQVEVEIRQMLDPLRQVGIPRLTQILERLQLNTLTWGHTVDNDVKAAMSVARSTRTKLDQLVAVDAKWAALFGFPAAKENTIGVNRSDVTVFLRQASESFLAIATELNALQNSVARLNYEGRRALLFEREVRSTIFSIKTLISRQVRDQIRMISAATKALNESAGATPLITFAAFSSMLLPGINSSSDVTLFEHRILSDISWVDPAELEGFHRDFNASISRISGLLEQTKTGLKNVSWEGAAKNAALNYLSVSNIRANAALTSGSSRIQTLVVEQVEDIRHANSGSSQFVRIDQSSVRRFFVEAQDTIKLVMSMLHNLDASVTLVRFSGPRANRFRNEYQLMFSEFTRHYTQQLRSLLGETLNVADGIGSSLGGAPDLQGKLRRLMDSVAHPQFKISPAQKERTRLYFEIDIVAVENLVRTIQTTCESASGRIFSLQSAFDRMDWVGAARDNSRERWFDSTNDAIKALDNLSKIFIIDLRALITDVLAADVL